jgi:hypothetical protein
MSSGDARGLAAEFKASRRLRPDAKRPVWHCPVALPPGEHLDDKRFAEVLDDFMNQMGFTDLHQWVAVLHEDKDHLHAHIVASRIALDGSLWIGEHEARRAIVACRRLEERHGLRPMAAPGKPPKAVALDAHQLPSKTVVRDNVHKANRRAARRGTQMNDPHSLRLSIEAALERATTVEQLKQELVRHGVEVEFSRRQSGEVYGWKLRTRGAGEWLKASSIARDLTWPHIARSLMQQADLRARARQRAGDVVQEADAVAARRAAQTAQRHAAQQERTRALQAAEVKRIVEDPLSFLPGAPPSAELLAGAPTPFHPDDQAAAGSAPEVLLRATLFKLKTEDLKRLRALAMHAQENERTSDIALLALLRRLIDLALRVLSLGTIRLPPTQLESEATARRLVVQECDAELARRRELDSRKSQAEVARPAPVRITRTFDPRRAETTTNARQDEDGEPQQDQVPRDL